VKSRTKVAEEQEKGEGEGGERTSPRGGSPCNGELGRER